MRCGMQVERCGCTLAAVRRGAGIGGGYNGSGSNLTISGGTVTATGGYRGEGIGGGKDGNGSDIFVADNILLKAGASANPTEVIPHVSPTTDIASSLTGKRYATAEDLDFATIKPEEVTGASTVNVYTNGTVEVTEKPYTVLRGEEVTVTYTADEGYEFPGGSKTWTTNVTANAATVTVTIPAGERPVARARGTLFYLTMAEAFEKATDGATITLLADHSFMAADDRK